MNKSRAKLLDLTPEMNKAKRRTRLQKKRRMAAKRKVRLRRLKIGRILFERVTKSFRLKGRFFDFEMKLSFEKKTLKRSPLLPAEKTGLKKETFDKKRSFLLRNLLLRLMKKMMSFLMKNRSKKKKSFFLTAAAKKKKRIFQRRKALFCLTQSFLKKARLKCFSSFAQELFRIELAKKKLKRSFFLRKKGRKRRFEKRARAKSLSKDKARKQGRLRSKKERLFLLTALPQAAFF